MSPMESYSCRGLREGCDTLQLPAVDLLAVAAGVPPSTPSITPSTCHVGLTNRHTLRPGFADAVGASHEEGYPVLLRSSGGGATGRGLGWACGNEHLLRT